MFAIGLCSMTIAHSQSISAGICPTYENYTTIITKDSTMVDASARMLDCMHDKDNKESEEMAVYLFALSGIMGKYDQARVADKTSYGAAGILRIMAGQTEPFVNFKETLGQYLENNEKRAKLCEALIKIEAPTYYPDYMINHGMAYMQNPDYEDKLNHLDNPQQVWEESVKSYLTCE